MESRALHFFKKCIFLLMLWWRANQWLQHQPVITGKLSEGRHTHNFAYDDVPQTKSHFSQSIIPSGIPRNPEYILLFWYLSACVPSQHLLPPFPLCYLSRSTQPNSAQPQFPIPTNTLAPDRKRFISSLGMSVGSGQGDQASAAPLIKLLFSAHSSSRRPPLF